MAKNKKQPASGIFDIARPGRSGLPADSTNRPIIVTNRPVIQDPMVSEPVPPLPTNKPGTKMTIMPLHDNIEADKPDETPPTPVKVEVATPSPSPEVAPDDTTPTPPEGFPEPVDDAALKPEDTPGVPPETEERKADSELAHKRAARLQKMIDEEEYFLPIKTIEERRSRKVAIFGIVLIVLLAAAWYNIALDAGLLPNAYNLPHTSFFTVQ